MCREVLVSGLREFLAEVNVGMPVTRLAKWKTAFQMTALSLILLGRTSDVFAVGGEVLLWVAGVLTFITGYQYFDRGLAYVKGIEGEKAIKAEVKAATRKVIDAAVKVKEAVKEKTKKAAKKHASAKAAAKAEKPASAPKAAKKAVKK